MEEQKTTQDNDIQEALSLSISINAHQYLAETGRWTQFLAIMGFILTGLIVIMGLFAGTLFSALSGGQSQAMLGQGMGIIFGGVYVLLGLLYFFPSMYLFNFSKKLKAAILTRDNGELEDALKNQKSFYKFWGVFTIVVICFYLVFGVFAALMGALAG